LNMPAMYMMLMQEELMPHAGNMSVHRICAGYMSRTREAFMEINKKEILEKLCYTELVYDRIRKKLSVQMVNEDIEEYIFQAIEETPLECFEKTGKNYYISNLKQGIRITINSYTTRIITADKILKNE